MFGETSTEKPPGDEDKMPEPLLIEKVEAVLLLILNTIYITVMLYHAITYYRQNRISKGKRPLQPNGQAITHNSFRLFKISLFLSDFMINFWYACPKAIWLLQFEWKLGCVMCKIYKYGSSIAFFSNSNIVCGIALDRYLSVYSNHIIGIRQYQRTVRMLLVIWALAAIAAIPQLFVWEAYQPAGAHWEQCVTKFAVANYNLPLNSTYRKTISYYSMLYEGYHQTMSFWLPLSITFGAYARMLSRLIPFWPFSVLNSFEDEQQQTFDQTDSKRSSLCGIFCARAKEKVCYFFCNTVLRKRASEQSETARVLLAGTGTTRHPPTTALRRQLGTTVFKNACQIICIHVILWLPYNLVSLSRFVHEDFYMFISTRGGNLCEMFILFNSFINPIIYSGRRAISAHRV
uniref:G_PROTEIN_RECEP_F1_2 domain-containing protein n=1 Tax=Caenorhabditis japonica TaxID=281687 RepID=A0A8R1HH72_CAEJA